MTLTRLLRVGGLVIVAAGCSSEKPPARPAADTATGPVENLEPNVQTSAAEPSRMGQMPLLRGVPSDFRCDSAPHSTGIRFVLQGDAPLRIMTTEVEKSGERSFAPKFLEVTSKQARGDGKEENDRIYVGFTPTGGMEMGQRTYFLTGSPPNDAGAVSPEDAETAKQIAQQVVDRCRGR